MYHSLTNWRFFVNWVFYVLFTKLVKQNRTVGINCLLQLMKEAFLRHHGTSLMCANLMWRFLQQSALWKCICFVNRKLKLIYKIGLARTSFLVSTLFHFNYLPKMYTVPCVMFLMRADPLRAQVGGGWPWKSKSFLGPVKWHRADRRAHFGPKKRVSEVFRKNKKGVCYHPRW